MQTERAAALQFDSAALDQCAAWRFDRDSVVADLRGRRMTPGTVAYNLSVNNVNPCGQYEQTDARGVDGAARAMEALRGTGGEGDTHFNPGENPNPTLPSGCALNCVLDNIVYLFYLSPRKVHPFFREQQVEYNTPTVVPVVHTCWGC